MPVGFGPVGFGPGGLAGCELGEAAASGEFCAMAIGMNTDVEPAVTRHTSDNVTATAERLGFQRIANTRYRVRPNSPTRPTAAHIAPTADSGWWLGLRGRQRGAAPGDRVETANGVTCLSLSLDPPIGWVV